jgi:hypothetical protein
MNLCKCFVVVLVGLGCAVVAPAQVGVYGMYSGEHLSNIQCFSPASVSCSNGSAGGAVVGGVQQGGATGSINPSGFSGGIYYDFRNVGPVRLGLDVRGGQGHSNKSAAWSAGEKNATEEYMVLAGVRGSMKTKYSWLTPYAEVLGGWTRSDATEPCTLNSFGLCTVVPFDNFVRYEAVGGADIHLSSILDLRLVELGIGNMNRIGSGTGQSSVGVFSVGAGIVLHLPTAQ